MPAPTLSIVMTVFESWSLFPRALACVLWQTYPEWELLVLSDGPAENSVHEALRSSRRLWRRRRVVVQECELAPGCWGNRARAAGLRLAEGTHVVWFNHDNLIAPSYLALHAAHFEEDPRCVSLVGIDLWQKGRFRKRLPEWGPGGADPLRAGRVDLLNYAVPRDLALEVEAFGPAMERRYAADWITLEACLSRAPLRLSETVAGVHF